LLTSSQPRQIGWPGYLALCAVGLALILTWLGPRSSEGLGTLNALVFWFAHVGCGLAVLAWTQQALGWIPRFGTLASGAQVIIGGMIGAIVFIPVAFGLDLLFQPPVTSDDVSAGAVYEIWNEFKQIVVPFVLFWLLVNAPTLVQLNRDQNVGEDGSAEISADRTAEFWQKVPKSLGRDLIAISAELHYLRVHTAVGDALILFAFGRVVELLDGPDTCQIHRSHWVRLPHVTDIVTGKGTMTCVLDNGLTFPVSRSHRKALKLGVRGNI